MKKLRVSIVEYLNAAPLVWGFTDGPLAGKYDLSFTVPSQCAEELRRGDADLGIIPSIEYQRIDGVVALPGMAIASKHEVRSLLVVAKKPIEMAKRIALDTSSRSTVWCGCSRQNTGESRRNLWKPLPTPPRCCEKRTPRS